VYASHPLPPVAPPPTSSRPVHVMTIDVEDYFHVNAFAGIVSTTDWPNMQSRVVRNTERLLDLFAAHRARCTFFVLGWVAERHPSLVARIAREGHELASHSYWHRLVYQLTPDQFREDLRRARDVIESAAGVRVRGFRAPSWSIVKRSLWALDVLAEEGYEYDASIFPIRHDVYGIPHAPRAPHVIERAGAQIIELPGSTATLGSATVPIGGGYFRLVPYAVTAWAIRRYAAVWRQPAMFYLHPWEIDPDQPMLPGPIKSRLRHYNQLGRTEPRLRRLLEDFSWDTVERTFLADRVATPRVEPRPVAIDAPRREDTAPVAP
jgi:polysaccharide deacetylase family protein (PEP-CTERM system associated)